MENNSKHPIHRHHHLQGKLYKSTNKNTYYHHQPPLSHPTAILELNPVTTATSPKKHRFFLKQHPPKRHFSKTISLENTTQTVSGAFRAIHTSNPLDTLKGFPLRSGTSLKPFRRGIRTSDNHSRNLNIDFLAQERPITRVPRARAISNAQPLSEPPKQQYVPKYNDQFEEFYVYQGSPRRENPQTSRKVAGTRIQPFRKYLIREWTKK